MGLMLKIFGAMAILAALGILPVERIDYLALLGSVFTGTFATPVLLPWIPGRAFSLKGMITGLLWTVLVLFYGGVHDVLQLISYLLILPSLSAFFGMNFTGSLDLYLLVRRGKGDESGAAADHHRTGGGDPDKDHIVLHIGKGEDKWILSISRESLR